MAGTGVKMQIAKDANGENGANGTNGDYQQECRQRKRLNPQQLQLRRPDQVGPARLQSEVPASRKRGVMHEWEQLTEADRDENPNNPRGRLAHSLTSSGSCRSL